LQDLRLILKARISSSVVGITGMALGWIGSTIAFRAVVRKPTLPYVLVSVDLQKATVKVFWIAKRDSFCLKL
jgi:hypothetical protein